MNKLWKYFVVVNLLNVLDVIQTLFTINELDGVEINPLMSYLLAYSQSLFVVFKLCFVLLLTVVLVKYNKERLLKMFIWMFGVLIAWNFLNIVLGLWWIP